MGEETAKARLARWRASRGDEEKKEEQMGTCVGSTQVLQLQKQVEHDPAGRGDAWNISTPRVPLEHSQLQPPSSQVPSTACSLPHAKVLQASSLDKLDRAIEDSHKAERVRQEQAIAEATAAAQGKQQHLSAPAASASVRAKREQVPSETNRQCPLH